MESYKFFLDSLLRAGGDDGLYLENAEDNAAAERLRLSGMVHVSSSRSASFITPFHRSFYQVWVYTLAGMSENLPRMRSVVNSVAEFQRFMLITIARMRSSELRNSLSVSPDGRVYERHYQVWHVDVELHSKHCTINIMIFVSLLSDGVVSGSSFVFAHAHLHLSRRWTGGHNSALR